MPLRFGGLGIRAPSFCALTQAEPHIRQAAGVEFADPHNPLSVALTEAVTHLQRNYEVDAGAATKSNLTDINTHAAHRVQKSVTDTSGDPTAVWTMNDLARNTAASCSTVGSCSTQTSAFRRHSTQSEGATGTHVTQSSHNTCSATLTPEADHVHGCTHSKRNARHHATRDLWHRAPEWSRRSQSWPDQLSHTRTSEPRKTTSPETRAT